MSGFRVYEPSGESSPKGLLLTFVCGVVGATILGVIYAYITAYNPLFYIPIILFLIGAYILNVIAPFAGGVLVGLAAGMGATMAHVRAPKKVAVVSMLAAFGFLWTSWMFWFRINGAPNMIWDGVHIVQELASVASAKQYVLFDSRMPAGVAWTVWGLEAALVFAGAAFGGKLATSDPYCESCGEWSAAQDDKLRLPIPLDATTLRARLEGGQIDALTPSTEAGNAYELEFHICPSCDNSVWLTLKELTFSFDDDGNPEENLEEVVEHLAIGGEGFKTLMAILDAPAEPPMPEGAAPDEQGVYAID